MEHEAGRVDLEYRPNVDDLRWLDTRTPEQGLILGRSSQAVVDGLADRQLDLRTHSANPWNLPVGTYAVRVLGRWVAIVVTAGAEPTAAVEGRARMLDSDVSNAASIFAAAWESGQPHSGRSRFKVDDLVQVRGEGSRGRVTRVILRPAGYEVEALFGDRRQNLSEESLDLLEGDPTDESYWITGKPADAQSMAFTLTWTKLRHPLTDTIYSYASSKTIFRPYQFLPVLKLLNSSSGRLLIADEVGLGKTIEAGLIWSELEQRTRLDRVLVVAPAALVPKWRSEMERRFDRRLDPLKARDLADLADRWEKGEDPHLSGIVSINALRDRDLLERLTACAPRFDLVIVDEAHALRNSGTTSHLLGHLLSDWSDYLVFLSATPLNLRHSDLFNLMNMLDGAEYDDPALFPYQLEPNAVLNDVSRRLLSVPPPSPAALLRQLNELDDMSLGSAIVRRPDFKNLTTLLNSGEKVLPPEKVARARRHLSELNTLSSTFTRTRKRDVPDRKAEREAIQVDVEWTDEERSFYEAVQGVYRRRAAQSGQVPGFAMQMPLRMAASCIPAMQRHFRERRPDLDIDDFDSEDTGAGAVPDDLRDDVLTALHPVSVDTKLAALREKMRQLRADGQRQAMVFSFFRGTLEYLARELAPEWSVAVMHGGVKVADRQVMMQDFREGKIDLLLLSQVGSEGLDFEFCNILVNYDMPWNPMQVEQRIGRLDRFGQEHDKIFILNMHIPGTIETDIFERLYQRIGLFQESIGDLEPILRDELSSAAKQILDPLLTPAQRAKRQAEIEVAIEKKRVDLEQIDESKGALAYADQLRIEGLSEKGPLDGRFVGPSEVRSVIERLLRRTGGSIEDVDGAPEVRLHGSAELSSLLRRRRDDKGRAGAARNLLAMRLLDPRGVSATFDSEHASGHDVELLSARHPLVTVAIEDIGRAELDLSRFGAVRVPGLPLGQTFVTRIELVSSTGVRPQLELWATAVDARSLAPSDEVEPALLQSLAHGQLLEARGEDLSVTSDQIAVLGDLAYERRHAVESVRREDNAALVEARIDARRKSIDLKRLRAEETLALVRREGRKDSVIRIYEGRLRNLAVDAANVDDDLGSKRHLSMSAETVAIIVVEGAGATDRR